MSTTLGEVSEDQTSTRSLIYPLLVVVSVLWLLHRLQQSSRIHKLANKLPGPMTLPFIGHALMALWVKPGTDFLQVGLDYFKAYGTVIHGWLGPRLFVFLTDPDDAEIILNSQVHIDKSREYKFFEPWLGEGLLISSGKKWRSHRKMIAPTFHINILKTFVPVFNQNSFNVVKKMRAEVGKTFDVHDYMSEVTVDILLETAMGITRKSQDQSGFDYAMAVMKLCEIINARQYKIWLQFEPFYKLTSMFKQQTKFLNIIHGLTNKVIKSKKQIYLENKAKGIIPASIEELTKESIKDNDTGLAKNNKTLFKGYRDDLDLIDEDDVCRGKKRLAFLDLMIESAESGANKINDHDIKEEVDTIMFEGHDTTAAGSSFVLCLLGVYQEVQTKVYEELFEVFGDSDRPVTFADTLRLKYLERVILESLRLFPPVPIIARELKKEVTIATNNYVLPAGATVVIGTYLIHRDPKCYKHPEVFNPDNFLPENTQDRHYYSYIPFSAGPRSCVGRKYAILKLKVLLANVLRNFKIHSDVPQNQFKLRGDIILKRSDGFQIRIEPRTRIFPNA